RFFCSSRRRHTSSKRDWSSDVCSSDLRRARVTALVARGTLGLALAALALVLATRATLVRVALVALVAVRAPMLATRRKATDESGPPDSPCSLVSPARRSLTFSFPRSFASPLLCPSSSPAPLLLPLDRCVIGGFSAENPDNATVDGANHDPIEGAHHDNVPACTNVHPDVTCVDQVAKA